MSKHRSSYQGIDLVPRGGSPEAGTTLKGGGFLRGVPRGNILRGVTASLLAFALVGCGGGSGGGAGSAGTPAGPAGAANDVAALTASTALTMTITGVTINSPPVVNFTVVNEAGVGMAGLAPADLRFNIAKLAPGTNGEPGAWQNYINVADGGAVQGSQEFSAGPAFGTLVNHGDGTYTYTFATDIRNPAANPCPAPCTDAAGKTLDLSFQPNTTHRVTIQQGNSAYPNSTGVFDFVPGGGAGIKRDIVLTSTCDQCHDGLTAHGTRVDTRLCVTCHNPGSWVAEAGKPNVTVDFKVMIHKIHDGSRLPSVVGVVGVVAPTPYVVNGTDFSKVVFPQDVLNCAKCHTGTLSAQGDNWKNRPNMEACSSCHDDVYFGAQPDPAKPYQRVAHPGGIMSDNSACALCHAAGRFTDKKDIVVAHGFPAGLKAAAARFKYNIISVTPTTAGATPVITFSVTDPTNADAPYDIKTNAAFTAGAASRLAIDIGWTASGIADVGNDGNLQNFGQPVSIEMLGNAAVAAGATPGTYTVTSTAAIPATQTGTLRVVMEGHPAGDVAFAGTFPLPVKSVFRDFAITGTAVPRRLVVDIAKCDLCHGVLSLHGSNRTDEPGVCAVCHNPNATDASQRPTAAGVLTGGTDGKLEESIDFKRMIHAIHAGEAGKGGFRTKGITVYGFGGRPIDFSTLVFPGKLSDCSACHAGTSYQLTGTWAAPTANGILGSTISTETDPADPKDNLRISPTAAVCSSCHDSVGAQSHMVDFLPRGQFSVTQAAIDLGAGGVAEGCSNCHGPGGPVDVKVVHGVK